MKKGDFRLHHPGTNLLTDIAGVKNNTDGFTLLFTHVCWVQSQPPRAGRLDVVSSTGRANQLVNGEGGGVK